MSALLPSLPTSQGVGTSQSGLGALTVAWPAGTQTNDVGLLVVCSQNETITLSTAAGFAQIGSQQNSGVGGGSPVSLAVFWCRAASSSPTSPVVAANVLFKYARIYTFRGCSRDGNPFDVTGAGVNNGTGATSLSVTGATAAQQQELVVPIVAYDVGSSTPQLSGWTNSSLASIAEIGDESNVLGGGIGVATGSLASGGTYGTTTVTSATSTQCACMSVALRPAWTVDASGGKVFPAAANEWTDFLAQIHTTYNVTISSPTLEWPCQDASGNATEVINTGGTLTAQNTPTYAQSITGYTRKGFGLTAATTQRFVRSSTPLVAGTTSISSLTFSQVASAPAATSAIFINGGSATASFVNALTTGKVQQTNGANNASGTATPFNGALRPYFSKHDVTHSICKLYTDQETVKPTFLALSGVGFWLGGSSAPATQVIGYSVQWQDTAAEMTDAQVAFLLFAMGWSVPWANTGDINGAGTSSAAFTGKAADAGSIAAAGTSSAALTGRATDQAAIASAGTSSGAFASSGAAGSTISGAGASAGALTGQAAARGAIAATVTSSGALTGRAAARAAIAGAGTASGNFTDADRAVASIACQATASGSFTDGGAVVDQTRFGSGSSGTSSGIPLTWEEVDEMWRAERARHGLARRAIKIDAPLLPAAGNRTDSFARGAASGGLGGGVVAGAACSAESKCAGTMTAYAGDRATDRERLMALLAEASRPHADATPPVVRRDVPSMRALATARQALMQRSMGQGRRRQRVPRQQYPKTLEMEYGKAIVSHLDRARGALAPLLRALPGLVERGQAERHDADEPARVRELIGKARDALERVTQPSEIEALARLFADRTQTIQRVQLGRQVRAALGADVFASDHRIATLRDHFVHENATLITTVPRDVVDAIERATTRAFTTGTSSAALARDIEERFDIGERHARLIARDQIGKLYGQTNAYRQQDLGIASFVWRTAGDERVRPEHDELDGETFDYDDPPDEGLPGEPICCRCYAEPVFAPISDAMSEPSEDEDE